MLKQTFEKVTFDPRVKTKQTKIFFQTLGETFDFIDRSLKTGIMTNVTFEDAISCTPSFNPFMLYQLWKKRKEYDPFIDVFSNLFENASMLSPLEIGKNFEFFHALYLWILMFFKTKMNYNLRKDSTLIHIDSTRRIIQIPSTRLLSSPDEEIVSVPLSDFYRGFISVSSSSSLSSSSPSSSSSLVPESTTTEDCQIPTFPGVLVSTRKHNLSASSSPAKVEAPVSTFSFQSGDLFIPEERNNEGYDIALVTGNKLHLIECKYSLVQTKNNIFSFADVKHKFIAIEKKLQT